MVIAFLPFSRGISNLFIIVATAIWLLEGEFNAKLKTAIKEPLLLSFFLFYLLFLFGMIYTSNVQVGLFNLEKKLSLLILPLIIGTSKNYGWKERNIVLWVFTATIVLATIICFLGAFYRYYISGDSLVFLHEEYASTIDFHPPYFAMFLMLAFMLLLDNFIDPEIASLKIANKSITLLLMTYIAFVILILSARTVAIFLLLLIIFLAVYHFYKKKRYWQSIVTIILILASSYILIDQSPYLKDRIIRPITSDIKVIDGGGETGLSIRIVKWRCSLRGIGENPIVGTGTGDAIDYLVKCYEDLNFWGMHPQYRFNAHNQFLETTLTFGFVGLTIFLLTLFLLFSEAHKRKNYVFLGFLILFCFASLTESLLERQWGVVFFSFFASVFYFGRHEGKAWNNA
ncbi:MAG: O-antigen ligase family protein [Cyclobacteriaceae bacterium]|nr:O-antigen ligase family protein [Cyclobacteriaceae bacterium]